KKLDRFRELTSERVRANPAGNHRLRRLAGASELRQAELRMAESIVGVKVVDVALIGLDEHASPSGLDTTCQGITERKIVDGRGGGARPRQALARAGALVSAKGRARAAGGSRFPDSAVST